MSEIAWETPTKRIYDASDLPNFKRSIGFKKLRHALFAVVQKVEGQEVPHDILNIALVRRKPDIHSLNLAAPLPAETKEGTEVEKTVDGIIEILNQLNTYIDEVPPLAGPRRFGNLACRKWHEKVDANVVTLLKQKLETKYKDGFYDELAYYLSNSFGSLIRLDYGTGHEMSYLAFIGSLIDVGILKDVSGKQLLTLFARYYDVARRLILDYNLEPAGSHGVWGLDDHFHLIYILGAAQFSTVKSAPPVSLVLSGQVINFYSKSNLYVNAVAFIYRIKLGPFNEHSPILYDIHTNVQLWSKVLQGLLRMYDDEVFGKFPVVQHFWLGNVLYPWRDVETNKQLPVNKREESDNDGFINGTKGVNTTKTNISMTAAPWANARQQNTIPRR